MVTPGPSDPPFNPYVAPVAIPREDDAEAAALRLPNLSREAAVRLVGSIAYIIAGFTFLGGLAGLVTAVYYLGLLGGRWNPGMAGIPLCFGLGWLPISLVYKMLGRNTCQLSPKSRQSMIDILYIIIAIVAILAVFFGSAAGKPLIAIGLLLIAITPTAALATLHFPRTARLFQPDYREAIALTPSLRPRLSLRARCLLALVLTLSASGIGLLVWSLR